MSDWTRLPPLDDKAAGLRSGCLTCGPQPTTIDLGAFIAVGFGTAGVSKDGVVVWDENEIDEADDEDFLVRDAEAMAAADPDHDWRIFFHGPLSEAIYQRHDVKTWVLVEKGMGFA